MKKRIGKPKNFYDKFYTIFLEGRVSRKR